MSKRTQRLNLNPLLIIVCLGLTLLSGMAGAIPTAWGLSWYASVNKPAYTPPNWVFGPVWTVLYILLGIVLYRIVIAKRRTERSGLLLLFTVQIILNILWSYLFFGLRSPLFALYDIIFLLFFISRMMFGLLRSDRLAAILTLPYFFWVAFASVLNYSVWILNI